MYICHCTNCMKEFEDTNPNPPKSIDYPKEDLPQLTLMQDSGPEDWMKACPICLTDAYLADNKDFAD